MTLLSLINALLTTATPLAGHMRARQGPEAPRGAGGNGGGPPRGPAVFHWSGVWPTMIGPVENENEAYPMDAAVAGLLGAVIGGGMTAATSIGIEFGRAWAQGRSDGRVWQQCVRRSAFSTWSFGWLRWFWTRRSEGNIGPTQ